MNAENKIRAAENRINAAAEDRIRAVLEKFEALTEELAPLKNHFSVICQGEITHAAMLLLGYPSHSNYPKASFIKYVQKNFSEYFRFASKKLPDITQAEFKGMLRILVPSPDNCYINSRNCAAHRFSIAQARESIGNHHPQLLKWIDILGANEIDQQTYIGDVAFKNAYPVSDEITAGCDLHSIAMTVKLADEEARLEFAQVLHDINNLRTGKERLEEEADEQALMKAGRVLVFEN